MLRLADNPKIIQATVILTIDLIWLSNNYQRSLTRYARRCSADVLRDLKQERRYAVLVCFLWQAYRCTINYMIDMHDKLMLRVFNRAQEDIDADTRRQRRMIRSSLDSLQRLGFLILDDTAPDSELRQMFFQEVDRERLIEQVSAAEAWMTSQHSHVYNLVLQRFHLSRPSPWPTIRPAARLTSQKMVISGWCPRPDQFPGPNRGLTP